MRASPPVRMHRSGAGSPPSDRCSCSSSGVIASAARGSGGGFVRVGKSNSTANASPRVVTTVAEGSTLSGLDAHVGATSIANMLSSSDNFGGGFVSIADANASGSTSTIGEVILEDNVSVTATRDVSVVSQTSQAGTVLGQIDSGGFASGGTSKTFLTQNFDSEVRIGNGVVMTATEGDLLADARTSVNGLSRALADAGGFTSSATADAKQPIQGSTQTTVGVNTQLTAKNLVSVLATVDGMNARAYAEADADEAEDEAGDHEEE